MAKTETTETRMKGYRVKVEYNTITAEEMHINRENLAEFLANNLK